MSEGFGIQDYEVHNTSYSCSEYTYNCRKNILYHGPSKLMQVLHNGDDQVDSLPRVSLAKGAHPDVVYSRTVDTSVRLRLQLYIVLGESNVHSLCGPGSSPLQPGLPGEEREGQY